jgi:flagellar biosynthesis/type III secretory pathway M-ring protein FliF/YscJ
MSISQLEEVLNTASLPALPDQAESSRERNPDEKDMLPLPQSNKADLVRSRIVEHARRDPETVARLVRTWLNDDGKG